MALESAEARAAYLNSACAGQPALRDQVEQLLRAHEAPTGFLDTLPDQARTITDPAEESLGAHIGRYKLLEKVGEGGCGVVYVAEQSEPVRRRVALKVIKLGMDTKAVVARFEAERQALAMMDHPNIAKVLDAGTTDTGRPYFVMELVRGIRITDYSDQNNLSTKDRLDLFIKICHAIQHAHQKGIIHRDIKPSNILVTLHDGVPIPKVIDFGIAKATEGRLTDATVYTQLHQFIGTPAYMSPEQAEMSALDVDTRSDIYSLGVLLYELLTGTTPFDANELMSQGLDALRRTIREQEPVRPSTRLTQQLVAADGGRLKNPPDDPTHPTDATNSRASSRRLLQIRESLPLIRGDLDWIVMKCLEKDRTRRYETANGLAMDLKRHLNHETVNARPPSTAYRIQKAIRRNKLAFASSVAVATALLAGIVLSGWQAGRATRERDKAVQAERRADEQRKAALAAQTETDRQRSVAEKRLFDSLLREMRSIATIRPLGYRTEVQNLARQALELPDAPARRDELRAEFTQILGDPLGFAPLTVAWDPPLGPADFIWSMALSVDGRQAAIWNSRDGLVIRDTGSGRIAAAINPPGIARARDLVFGRDGRSLFALVLPAGAGPRRFQLAEWRQSLDGSWSRRDRPLELLLQLCGTRAGVFAVKRPNEENAVEIVNIESGELFAAFSPPLEQFGGGLRAVSIAPGRKLIAIGVGEVRSRLTPTIEVWNLAKPAPPVSLQAPPGIALYHTARFSPDERYLAAIGESGAVIYETTGFEIVSRTLGYLGLAEGAFVGDGASFVIPRPQLPGVRLLSVLAGTVRNLEGTEELVSNLTASEDGSTLMMAADQNVAFLRLLNSTECQRFFGHSGGVTALEFSPDGRQLASTGKDGFVRFWDGASGKLRRSFVRTNAMGQALAFSADGQWLVMGEYRDDQLRILDVDTGREILALGEPNPSVGQVWGCGFTPDRRHVVAVGRNFRAWEITGDSTAQPQARLVLEENGSFRNLIFDPANRWFAFYEGRSRNVVIKDLSTLQTERSFPANAFAVQAICPVPGTGRLAFHVSSEKGRSVEFRNPATGQIERTLPVSLPGERPTTYISNMRFAPDGSRFALASHDGRRAHIYDTASGRRLYSLPDDNGVIWWLAWHPDGRQLAIGRESGDFVIWNLPAVEATLSQAGLAP